MMREPRPDRPSICDYEGSNYRTEFWENQGRDYEDRVERAVLRRLMPERGRRLLEIGAGFGRLTAEYLKSYDQIVLLDYSFSQLEYARDQLGAGSKFIYVAADAYALPFKPAQFDGVSMIRTIHHMANVQLALQQVARVMTDGGVFMLEHANKQNFKAMTRYALKRQSWNPYTREPYEFVELNFVFHPQYMVDALEQHGFAIERRVPISWFRLGALKRVIPAGTLAALDTVLQYSGLLLTPSIFVRSSKLPAGGPTAQSIDVSADPINLFVCPESGGPLTREGDVLYSPKSGLRWAIRDGIFDFKVPLNET
ncbi:MAG: type 12 methyltransferase [Chloroflexi bacterium OLB13]|nr:MAG: type 12 methyltransferase [Chloroflexi bacterium OLB13]